MPELSDNQTRLMRAIRRATNAELTTRELGGVKDTHRQPIGADPARKIMGRLEKRGLVTGAGKGNQRKWWLLGPGVQAIDAIFPPAEVDGSPQRPYHVLEQVTAEQLRNYPVTDDTRLFVEVATVDARNTRHVYQQASDYYEGPSEEPVLVGVADRMFQPKNVPLERRAGAPTPA